MISETSFGHKAANLYKLDHLCKSLAMPEIKVCVPPFICFSHAEILEHIEKFYPLYHQEWNAFIQMHSLSSDAQLHLWKIQEALIHLFSTHHFVTDQLQAFLAQKDRILVVRSTGREDSKSFSNAGGNRSESGILPETPLISEAIGKVVASYHSIKSLRLRTFGEDNIEAPPFLSVFVQEMIGEVYESNRQLSIPVSGILHTQEMLGHTPNVVQVQALYGHNDGLVKNILPFDTFYIQPGSIHSISRFKKKRLVAALTGEFIHVDNPWELRISPTLPAPLLYAFHQLGQDIEAYFEHPIEMEWIYVNGTLYLVQARPLLEKGSQLPSYVNQESLHKHSVHYEEFPIEAVVSKGSVTILSDPKEWIQDVTIERAFNHYLREDKPALKAMISQLPAAATSHAACSLREKGIEVFSGVQLSLNKTCALLDPQQGKAFVLEEEWIDKGIIEEGWVSHPIPALESVPQEFESSLPDSLPEALFDEQKIHHFLIEAAFSNEAVEHLLNIFDAEARRLEGQAIFFERANRLASHAREIAQPIFAEIPRMQRLHALKRLEALFFQKKSADILHSDSLQEILREQSSIFDREKYILTAEGKGAWRSFTENLLHDSPEIIKRLEVLIGEIQKLHVTEEWINLAFTNSPQDLTSQARFLQLETEFKELYPQIHYISDSRKILKQWRERVPLWSDPNRFDSLYVEFTHQFLRDLLESTTLFFSSSNWLVRTMLIRFVQEAIEVYDHAIKSLKGSSEYPDKPLQVKRFKQMLQPLFGIMKLWVEHIPNDKISEWVRSVENFGDKIPGDYRQTIIDAIQQKMGEIISTNEEQLWPSNDFNVNALVISSAYFKSQELPQNSTLEDLCTLMHQNLIAAQMTHFVLLWEGFLPPVVVKLHKKLLGINKRCEIRPGIKIPIQTNWTGLSYVYPHFKLHYNIPVKNHSTIIQVNYNLIEKRADVAVRMIGHNRGGRMDDAARNIYMQNLIDNCRLRVMPAYDQLLKMLEFEWTLSDAELRSENCLSSIAGILTRALEETLLEKGKLPELKIDPEKVKSLWESKQAALQWFKAGAPYFRKVANDVLNQEQLLKLLSHLGGTASENSFLALLNLLKTEPAYFKAYGDENRFYGLNEFSDWALNDFFLNEKTAALLVQNSDQIIYAPSDPYDTKMFYLALQMAILKKLKGEELEKYVHLLIDHQQTETIVDLFYTGSFKNLLQKASAGKLADGYPVSSEIVQKAKPIVEMKALHKGDHVIVQLPQSKHWLKATVLKASRSDSIAEPFGSVKLRLSRGRVVKIIDPFCLKRIAIDMSE